MSNSPKLKKGRETPTRMVLRFAFTLNSARRKNKYENSMSTCGPPRVPFSFLIGRFERARPSANSRLPEYEWQAALKRRG
ncbi:hypothetical protein [Noviherbaspirillum sp.]|jgi:hypothetical protein|uniref:hypothetical protein n=1 Tax=Noviherbaspirillum sp. TaxID=1926288 RepID=UPI0025F3DC5C|nr:hypothetical protein [Noviherbaspirillum sp.]